MAMAVAHPHINEALEIAEALSDALVVATIAVMLHCDGCDDACGHDMAFMADGRTVTTCGQCGLSTILPAA